MSGRLNPPSVLETAFECPHCGAYTTQPAQLVAFSEKFEIYHIRSVLHGGDADGEVVGAPA